ncbi:MAG: FAD-dependent oxidoreductase [Candidatus Mcinerneyibacterium aminivorans]|uniref:FAD-dependent oxidoreductase n=1 Tax=Candidatus Mcinerneyibacterium aminivorans TaxID=2703815 RepID=A0A5D0MKW4_9BACT|nr:MAG: FAD-dependent oxidoreductase [Candidatus Mcinerneyibacterium aminivorans]
MEKKDIVIIGAGPAGIFTALELLNSDKNFNIHLFEKGKRIGDRHCPKRRTGNCANCEPCNITTGFSGAGAYSDGKLSLSPFVGGLDNFVQIKKLKNLIDYTYNQYYSFFGAKSKTYGIDNQEEIKNLKKKAIKANLKLIDYPLKHLGTDRAKNVYKNIQNYLLENKINIHFQTKVTDLILENKKIKGVITEKNKKYKCNAAVITVGREGSEWLKKITKQKNISTKVNPVDIGIRLEVRNEVMEKINKILYEGKLIYYTETYDDKVRTFCQNPSGFVSTEYYENRLATVNGHSYKEKKSENTNLALLVSHNFDHPFNQPIEYGKKVAEMGNMLADGKILMQRFGDFIRGRRSTKKRIKRGNIFPTLEDAEPGDLGHAIPYRTMLDLKETIFALDKLIPGIAGDETLLYGIEVKFYSNRIHVNNQFETNIKNLYAGGDGAGLTRGLMHASVNGVLIAQAIKQNLN